MNGKVVIVTGATKGMGRAIVERVAQEGGKVVVASRNAEECAAAADELDKAYGSGTALAQRCDIETKPDLNALVAATLARFGRIDGLVCCACAPPWWGPSRETPDPELDHQFLSVFKSKFWLSNMCIPPMIEAGGGSIVYISSGSAFEATTERSVYACLRAAEIQLMKNIGAEFGEHNIRVNAVSPGLIRTFSSGPIFADAAKLAESAARVPMRRTGEPEEIAATVAYLLSADSSFTTGCVVPVDGGRLLRAVNNQLTSVLAAQNEEAVGTNSAESAAIVDGQREAPRGTTGRRLRPAG